MGELVFLAVVKMITTLVGLGIVVWGLVAFTRARSRRIEPGPVSATSLRPIEERLRQLEQSTESIALQVERIAEGQRFVTKLLGDGTNVKPQAKSVDS
jgi:hypothetical protein